MVFRNPHSRLSLSSTRSRLRFVAFHLLWIWLLALSTGIVNACVVSVPDLQQRSSAAPHQPHDTVVHVHHDAGVEDHQTHQHGHQHEHQHDAPGTQSPPCAKFCDDESATVPTYKSPSEPTGKVWMFALPSAPLVAAAGALPTSWRLLRDSPRRVGVPIRIAFLRLTR